MNPKLVMAFGHFTTIVIANVFDWTNGRAFMRGVGVMSRIPKHLLPPIVLMLTLMAIYLQEARMSAMWLAVGFGVLGYAMRRIGMSPLPFVIAFILCGKLEDTIAIYVSDHGDWLGDHGLILKGPMHHEGLLQVPMIVAGPGVPAGKAVDQPVSTLDLGPTFFDYGGAEPMLTQHGQSLRPMLENDATRDFALNEWGLQEGRVGVALELCTVRTRTHKMNLDLNPGAGELYDLQTDPDELVNLLDDPTAGTVRKQLEGYLDARPDDVTGYRTPVGTA